MQNHQKHISVGRRVVFGSILFFSIIELAISAWLVSRYNIRHDYLSIAVRNRSRFLLFTSCWTIFTLSLLSLLPSIASHALVFFSTFIFWLAGAAAITSALGGGLNCSAHFTYCGQLNALEAFAWIIWLLVFFASVVVIYRAASVGYGGMREPLVPK